jgi:hypothetical protein
MSLESLRLPYDFFPPGIIAIAFYIEQVAEQGNFT